MFNQLLLYVIFILFIYSAVFTLYFLAVVLASMKKSKSAKPADLSLNYNKLAVIVYSHDNERTAACLLEQLNKQDYPKENYQVHIILDNCRDNSANKLEFIGGAKIWRLTGGEVQGKDKAVSWVLENLMSSEQFDAYVFLSADRIVKTDYLKNVNDALQHHNVITGASEIFLEDAGYSDKVWADVNEYNTGIMKKGRSALGLAVPIDSDNAAIKHKVLEKVKCIDFKDANSELKYSFLLTKVNCPPVFEPSVKTYISSNDYKVKRADFQFKLLLFCRCFNLRAFSNFRFIEFLFSLFKPNPIVIAAIIAVIAVYSLNYYFIGNFPWAVFMAAVLAVTFAVSLYSINMYYFKNIIYLISCPFYTLADAVCSMTLIKKLLKRRNSEIDDEFKTEKITVPVNVTNGKNIFQCSLDLINEGGFKKAVFRYKNKKQETNQSFVRMCDAVKNISDILSDHGFQLQICRSCAYFSPKIDGTNNMVKGYCSQKSAAGEEVIQAPETLLWSSCGYFIPQEINSVIDISKFIKQPQKQ